MRRLRASAWIALVFVLGMSLGTITTAPLQGQDLTTQLALFLRQLALVPYPTGLFQSLFDGVSANSATQNFYTCVNLTSLPANVFSKNGDEVRFDILTNTSGTDASVQVHLNLGGTCTSGATGFTGGTTYVAATATAAANGSLNGTLRVFRTGTNTQGGRFDGVTPGASVSASNYSTSALTETAAIPVSVALRDTAASPSANAIILQNVQVWIIKAP